MALMRKWVWLLMNRYEEKTISNTNNLDEQLGDLFLAQCFVFFFVLHRKIAWFQIHSEFILTPKFRFMSACFQLLVCLLLINPDHCSLNGPVDCSENASDHRMTKNCEKLTYWCVRNKNKNPTRPSSTEKHNNHKWLMTTVCCPEKQPHRVNYYCCMPGAKTEEV